MRDVVSGGSAGHYRTGGAFLHWFLRCPEVGPQCCGTGSPNPPWVPFPATAPNTFGVTGTAAPVSPTLAMQIALRFVLAPLVISPSRDRARTHAGLVGPLVDLLLRVVPLLSAWDLPWGVRKGSWGVQAA